MARILVVDDDEGVRSYLADVLDEAGHAVHQAPDGEVALQLLARRDYPLVVTDLKMPGIDGLDLVSRVKAEHPHSEVIVVTAHGTVDTAVEAMKRGAFDYLQKPLSCPAELEQLASRALERHRLRAHREASGDILEPRLSFGSPRMARIEAELRKVAVTQATVLLQGESGTGKEVAAQAIHRWSPRSDGPFVAVNCAALSETLLESELFGHEKGAFTGASVRRRGRIELAAGGTFFLDEVGELKPDLQARLLRVLQEKSFERVGGNQAIDADVRWVAATNRDLNAMVRDGSFRQDLYFRLAVFPVELPPLRDRPQDLAPLAEILLQRIAAELGRPGLILSDGALTAITARSWPGNIRELANALERAAILTDGDELDASWLSPANTDATDAAVPTMEQAERDAIARALEHYGGNRRLAAEHLGIGLRTLYDKIKRFDI